MPYFSEIAKKAINSASGEKMTDWEGRKASDHKDMYTRDTYMPKEDANVRRHYRAKGGTIPELQSKKGGRMSRHADGDEVKPARRGGHMSRGKEKKRADGGGTGYSMSSMGPIAGALENIGSPMGGALKKGGKVHSIKRDCHGGSVRK